MPRTDHDEGTRSMSTWLGRLFGRSKASTRRAVVTAEAPATAPAATSAEGLRRWRPALDVDLMYCRWLLDADVASEGPPDNAQARLLAGFESAAASGGAAGLTPRMPAVVPQLLQTLRNPQHTSSALSRLVAQDPVLVAAVLRVANSPYYRSGREIESIEQAVLVLGDDGLRQLVASVAFRPLINVQSGHFTRRGAERVWDQSEKTAVACRMLAPAAGASSFEAHLASLLQNIGTIVAMRLLDERYDGAGASGSTRFCATFLAAARQLACAIGQRWAFPESVTTAVAQQERIAAASSPLAALLRACDQVSKLRLLVDAGRVAGDDPRLGIGDQSLIAGCLAELGTRSAAAPA